MPSISKKQVRRLKVQLGVLGILILALGIIIGKCSMKDETTSALFVQQAVTGSLRQNPDGTYLLTMIGIKPHTLIFADRPQRMVGSWTNTDFFTRWSEGANDFNVDPPHAVLLSHSPTDGKEYSVAVELTDPFLDGPGGWISYTAKVLGEADPQTMTISGDRHMEDFPEILRSPALFIDRVDSPK
jgi:hypothetical protein